jgi:plastocyanin
MTLRGRLFGLGSAMTLTLGGLASLALPASAQGTTFVIGVDNATPSPACTSETSAGVSTQYPTACHNFEYTDFFPNGNAANAKITVHNGDVINFKLNASTPDGFHTATLLKPGETQQQAFSEMPLIVPDNDTGDASGQLQANPAVAFPTNPPPGSGAPGACGDATTPCTYDGTKDENSGAMFNGGPSTQISYKLSGLANGTVVAFVCMIHPGMTGQLTVDNSATASTQAQLDSAGATQYNQETSDGLAAESAANSAGKTTNANGTSTWTLSAGIEGANNDAAVQVLEMLPSSLNIQAGDTVRWNTTTTREIHSVTFPAGNASVFGPLSVFAPVCEGSSADTPPNAPPPQFCSPNPAAFEFHYNPQPQGGTSITSTSTQASSGAIANGIPQLPNNYSFNFPTKFTTATVFTYTCTVHEHMQGTITESAVAAAATAPAASPAALAQTGGAHARPASARLLLPIAVFAVLVPLTLLGWRLRRRTRA